MDFVNKFHYLRNIDNLVEKEGSMKYSYESESIANAALKEPNHFSDAEYSGDDSDFNVGCETAFEEMGDWNSEESGLE